MRVAHCPVSTPFAVALHQLLSLHSASTNSFQVRQRVCQGTANEPLGARSPQAHTLLHVHHSRFGQGASTWAARGADNHSFRVTGVQNTQRGHARTRIMSQCSRAASPRRPASRSPAPGLPSLSPAPGDVTPIAPADPWQPHNAHLGRQWTWTSSQHECRENNSENVWCNAKMAARKARRPRLPVSLHCKCDGEPWMTRVLLTIGTTLTTRTRLPAALGPRPGQLLFGFCLVQHPKNHNLKTTKPRESLGTCNGLCHVYVLKCNRRIGA